MQSFTEWLNRKTEQQTQSANSLESKIAAKLHM